MRSSHDPYVRLAELHERLAEGWRLLGRDEEATMEYDHAADLRRAAASDPAPAEPARV